MATKPRYVLPGKDRFGEALPTKNLRTKGTLKQRDLDAVVESVGGRRSKIAQEAREVAADVASRNKGPFAAARARNFSVFGKAGKTMVKGALRGMLSPAGLAEGVVGATVKAMRDSGAPMTPQELMKKKGMPKGRVVKGTRRGERA